LKTHNAICMTTKDLGRTSSIFPIGANLEPILINIFPWTKFGSREVSFFNPLAFASVRRRDDKLAGTAATTHRVCISLVRSLQTRILHHCFAEPIIRNRGQIWGPFVQATSSRTQLLLTLPISQSLPLEERKSPTTLRTFPINVLFTHPMPDHIIIGQYPPPLTHLRCFAQRCSIQVTQDLVCYFDGQSRDEVDSNKVSNGGCEI